MKKGMNVLSLFDGMSCGQIALKRAGKKIDNYFASEIKEHAIKVTQHNYPNTIQLGDVSKIKYENNKLFNDKGEIVFEGKIDLLLGGSPCQDFSFLKSQYTRNGSYGLNGTKSSLFLEYDRLLREVDPEYFLLENVKMKEESKNELTNYLNEYLTSVNKSIISPILINSSHVSAQIRKRNYWTNIEGVIQPIDRGIKLCSVLETNNEILKNYKVKDTPSRRKMWGEYGINGECIVKGKCKNITNEEKSSCLTTKMDRWNNAGLIKFEDFCRFLTPLECEKLQTVYDDIDGEYTSCLNSNSQRYDLLGDGWCIDVIVHILSFMR